MNHQEARRLVQLGLDYRKEEKVRAEKEAKLEEYERDMITACNGNNAAAKTLRLMDETDRINREFLEVRRKEHREMLVAQRREHREKMMREWERDNTAMNSVKMYVLGCMSLMLVTVWTPMPWWAAAATIIGTAVCEAAYLFRLYFPADNK